MYAWCVRWFIPENMTGAKLLGMHETLTSPTEYRSRHGSSHGDAGVVQGSYADDVGGLKPSGVTSGQRPRLLGGYRAQWLYGRWLEGSDLSGDSDCRLPKPRPRLDALRIGWLQARYPGESPRSTATSPLPGDKGAEPRRSHLTCSRPGKRASALVSLNATTACASLLHRTNFSTNQWGP